MASEQGQRVGDYEILSLLGTGGMGRVYKVRSAITNREEAMKILLPDFASEPELAARFMAEIRTLAGLDHPNITQLRTALQIQNQFVMVMEYVEGTTLDKVATQLPIEQVLDYSMQALAALSYAHSRGVTHRDIKPANIMITTHGVVKLMDFGIAKSTTDLNLTRPGTTMGSIYYMSPEQVRGGTVDGRTDIYSFGVTLYEMLTGRKPFQAETSYTVLNAQLNEAPTPPAQWNPALPRELNDIVLRAMAKDPAARFQTADEFRAAIKGLRDPSRAAHSAAAVAAVAVPAAAAEFSPAAAPPPFQQTVIDSAPPVAAPSQGFTPVSVGAAPVPASGKSNRSLWIALGALAAVLAVAAAFAVLPHFYALHASQKASATAATTETASSTPPPAAQPDATPPAASPASSPATSPVSSPSSSPASNSASTPAGNSVSSPASNSASSPAAPQDAGPAAAGFPRPAYREDHRHGFASRAAADSSRPFASSPGPGRDSAQNAVAPSPASGPSPEEMHRARNRYMDLDARADAVRSGIEQLRHQQQAQGFDLRGDMVGALNRMNNSLREADRALNEGDLAAARESMDRANTEMQRLESFLGR
jgi:serine/threonine-protein kinase